jgi:hypothetical protein
MDGVMMRDDTVGWGMQQRRPPELADNANAVETAAGFRESNRAARLLADDDASRMAHMIESHAWHGMVAGHRDALQVFSSVRIQQKRSLTIMTSSTVQYCSHLYMHLQLQASHPCMAVSYLKKQTAVTVTSVTMIYNTALNNSGSI